MPGIPDEAGMPRSIPPDGITRSSQLRLQQIQGRPLLMRGHGSSPSRPWRETRGAGFDLLAYMRPVSSDERIASPFGSHDH